VLRVKDNIWNSCGQRPAVGVLQGYVSPGVLQHGSEHKDGGHDISLIPTPIGFVGMRPPLGLSRDPLWALHETQMVQPTVHLGAPFGCCCPNGSHLSPLKDSVTLL
jgi:hypothetical protein